MSTSDWSNKIDRYRLYKETGAFARRYGQGAKAGQPFLVLTLTTSARRAENLREVARSQGAAPFLFFATLSDFSTDGPFAPIWLGATGRTYLPGVPGSAGKEVP